MSATGLSDLRQRFDAAPEKARTHLKTAVFLSTSATSNRVEEFAPKDTGRLSRAISFESKELTGRVLIDREAYYWRMIEYGYTVGFSGMGGRRVIGARPFVRTAAELETEPFVDRVRDATHRLAAGFK